MSKPHTRVSVLKLDELKKLVEKAKAVTAWWQEELRIAEYELKYRSERISRDL